MKIKLNIKGKKKLYQKVNWPIVAAFLVSLAVAAGWLRMTHDTHLQYSKKISERQSQNAVLKKKNASGGQAPGVTETREYIDAAALERINKKLRFLEKFSGARKYAFSFFDGLEKSITGEIFINKISSTDKINEYIVEGISSNADNISEFVNKLQSREVFSKTELVAINGGGGDSRCMSFSLKLVYEKDPRIEFAAARAQAPGKAR